MGIAMMTKDRALALFDAGQTGPAARVAGGKTYLDQWLAERASKEPPIRLPNDNIEHRPGRPKGQRTKRLLAHRLAARHADLPIPNGSALLYHVAHSRRSVAEMKRLATAIRAAASAACAEFELTEHQIINADTEKVPRYQGYNARAAFVFILLDLAPDIMESEIAHTLGVERSDILDIKALHKAEASVNDAFRNRTRHALGIAREIIAGKKVATPST